MNKIIFLLLSCFFLTVSCGGGSSTSTNATDTPTGNAPTGNISGQVDPVQST